jgi:hypothetical protein
MVVGLSFENGLITQPYPLIKRGFLWTSLMDYSYLPIKQTKKYGKSGGKFLAAIDCAIF